MEKVVGAFEVRRQFGKVLQGVLTRGDTYIIERHGEKVAAVVPMEIYEQWKQDREKFFEELSAIQKEANLSPEEAESLVDEAVRAVRAEKSAK